MEDLATASAYIAKCDISWPELRSLPAGVLRRCALAALKKANELSPPPKDLSEFSLAVLKGCSDPEAYGYASRMLPACPLPTFDGPMPLPALKSFHRDHLPPYAAQHPKYVVSRVRDWRVIWDLFVGSRDEEVVGREIFKKHGLVITGRVWTKGMEVAGVEGFEEAMGKVGEIEGTMREEAAEEVAKKWPERHTAIVSVCGGEGVAAAVVDDWDSRRGEGDAWTVLLGSVSASNTTVGKAVVRLCATGRFDEACEVFERRGANGAEAKCRRIAVEKVSGSESRRTSHALFSKLSASLFMLLSMPVVASMAQVVFGRATLWRLPRRLVRNKRLRARDGLDRRPPPDIRVHFRGSPPPHSLS